MAYKIQYAFIRWARLSGSNGTYRQKWVTTQLGATLFKIRLAQENLSIPTFGKVGSILYTCHLLKHR